MAYIAHSLGRHPRGRSREWLRVESNAGAPGWAHATDLRRLDAAPAPPPD